MRYSYILLALSFVAFGCITSSRHEIALPLSVKSPATTFEDANGWRVSLQEAKLAIGPIYFCASTEGAPDNCGDALAEFREVAIVDLLQESSELENGIRGFNGLVASYFGAYGRVWLKSESKPKAINNTFVDSARFVFEATRENAGVTESKTFSFEIQLNPLRSGEWPFFRVRTSGDLANVQRAEVLVDLDQWISVDIDSWINEGEEAQPDVFTLDRETSAHQNIAQKMVTEPIQITFSR